jgi:hypothetical protein
MVRIKHKARMSTNICHHRLSDRAAERKIRLETTTNQYHKEARSAEEKYDIALEKMAKETPEDQVDLEKKSENKHQDIQENTYTTPGNDVIRS